MCVFIMYFAKSVPRNPEKSGFLNIFLQGTQYLAGCVCMYV